MKRYGLLLLLLGCSSELPPLAEALVVVDTDVPVRRVASRLRVTFYDANGTWYEARDIARPDPRDWPVSFSVFSNDETSTQEAWLRLRLYPEGGLIDAIDDPLSGTVSRHPKPLVTVDQLLHISLEPGVRGRVRTTLHAACAGTVIQLEDALPALRPVLGEAQSCIASEKQREVVVTSELEIDNLQTPTTSAQPGQTESNCDSGNPDRVCIRGAITILGSSELVLYPDFGATPERIVSHTRFLIDRNEVSVGAFRAALAAGFAPANLPVATEGPIGVQFGDTCTWSISPQDREDYPLNCVTWNTAREYCSFHGGDLPSEAQWEHAGTSTLQGGRSHYPWGEAAPTCDHAVFGRLALAGLSGVCQHLPGGPQPIEYNEIGDVTSAGVAGMAGGVSEWLRDAHREYSHSCWQNSPLRDPICIDDSANMKSVRGAAWAAPPVYLASALRQGVPPNVEATILGFRCVYPAPEGPQ